MAAKKTKPTVIYSAHASPHLELREALSGGAVSDLAEGESQTQQSDPEMQSPRLRFLQTALEESRDRYMDLYTFAPIGYLTLTSKAVISEINLAGVGMLMGQGHEEVLQRRFALFVTPEDRSRYLRVIAEAKKDGGRHSCALSLQRCDGSTFHAQLDCVRERVGGALPKVRVTITDLTERRRMESEIENLAFYDSLTRLPNRRRLMDRLQQATIACADTEAHGALLMIDLDDFKTLNDTQGHDAGDQLLQQAAQRLTECLRALDTVARLGGDEFVVLLEGLNKEPMEAAMQVKAVGEKILSALNGSYLLGVVDYHGSGSIGATLLCEGPESAKDLLKRADLALYRAKADGGGVLRFFEQEMQDAVIARATLETDLRRGLKDEEFVLYYQPQVDHEGRLTGAEALLRWQHPSRGLLSPGEFIPLAEEKGFIVSLGQWVLEAACLQLIAWSGSPDTAHLTLSANVSAHEFRHPKFATRTLEIIKRVGADPWKLILEFTESSLLGNVEETVSKIKVLRTHGLRFSLDDFGIGYSSLSYLKNLPIDELKVDRSFISDVATDAKDGAIAVSIITLGKNLGLAVIAEGVETVKQRDFLLDRGCQRFQGYLFGRPTPIANWPSGPCSLTSVDSGHPQ